MGEQTLADTTEDIRNIALAGHAGSGKTTLVERLLQESGAIPEAGSVVRGDLVVKDSTPSETGNPPRIVIGPKSQILGELRFERDVRLYVHESARIGRVTGAEPVRYSGAAPGDG